MIHDLGHLTSVGPYGIVLLQLKIELSKGVEEGKALLMVALESKDKGAFMTILKAARGKSKLLVGDVSYTS